MKILIKSDIYNICNRIKVFDKTYRLVYNCDINKYQIYSTNLGRVVEKVGSICMSYVSTLPYEELDERSIRYLRNTMIDNINEYINEIDRHNQKLEYENGIKVKNQSLQFAEERLRQLTK